MMEGFIAFVTGATIGAVLTSAVILVLRAINHKYRRKP